MALYTTVVSFLILLIITAGECGKTKDMMYMPIDGVYCFRRLTATNQYGCSSSLWGDTGVLHFVRSSQDVDWIVKSGVAGPYIAVVHLKDFNRVNMLPLRDSGKISGMILYKNGSLDAFSTDDTCPNRRTGLASDACDVTDTWNPVGNALMLTDWGFPITYVKDDVTLQSLSECFQKYNSDLVDQEDRPLCAVQIKSHMLAAINTEVCVRRSALINNLSPTKYCDPMGDYNVYLMGPGALPVADRSLLVLAARQDGASMFDGLTPGAMNPITSLVTFLTVASHLKDMGAFTQPAVRNLLMVLFNGEAFDYIGSSRLVYDMKQNVFPSKENPVSLAQIGLIVELDQLTGSDLYFHTHSFDTPLVGQFLSGFKVELDRSIKISQAPGKLPPASLQRFLLEDPAIPSLLISNYNSSYKNQYYNSIVDDATNLGYVYGNGSQPTSEIQTKISLIAVGVAKTLYALMHDKPYTDVLKPNVPLVDELLHCYLDTQNCSMFRNVSNNAPLPDTPAPVYVGVYNNNNTITRLTGLTLALLTGTKVPGNASTCDNLTSPDGMQFIWMNDECIRTGVSYSPALSPAFEITGYNWTSDQYSTWSESIWRDLSMQMFLRPSYRHEVLNITVGLFVLIISFALVYFINAKSDILFNRVVLRAGGEMGGW